MTTPHFAAVTPSDAVNLPVACSDFFVGGTGNIQVTAYNDPDSAAVVLPSVAAGILRLPWPVIKIWKTGTTATGIIGLGMSSA